MKAELREQFEKETGTSSYPNRCDSFDYEYAYIEWLEQRASKLQALKEEVEKLKSYPMVYDSYSGEAQMVDKAAIIEFITNLED